MIYFKKLFSKWWFWPVIFGVVIRLILMPITLHADLLGHSFTAYFLAYEGKLNPYETLANLPPTHPLVRNFGVSDIFIYPPLTYFTLGFFRLLIKPFTDPNFIPFVMAYPQEVHLRQDLFLNLFLFKLPYLFIDIFCAFLLAKCFEDSKKRKLAFSLWMFNPLTLYATFMIGQIDILPTFFLVLAIYFATRKKFNLSVLSLGIGACYKMYPILLLLPAAFIFGKTIKEKIKYILIGVTPLALTLLPFINSKAFRYMVFSPKSAKMLFMGWNVSGAEVIYPFILILSIIYFTVYYSKIKHELAVYFLAILLLIFSVTHYHPQWFLWAIPFIVWQQVIDNFKFFELVITLFISWLLITLFFEPSLSIGLFNPLNPALNNITGLSDVIDKYFNVFQIKSVIRSLFAAASMFYVYKLFSPQDKVE